jgi:uncharacterized protein (DUF1499 family)
MNKVVYPLVVSVGFLAILLLYIAGAGYQRGAFELGQAFALMRYCAYAGIGGATLSIFYILWQRPLGLKLVVIFTSALLGLVAFYLPYRQQQLAQLVPPIHDITTDTANPPAFVAVAPLRATAPNPVAYEGEAVASLQRAAYPDIRTMVFANERAAVFSAAAQLIAELGWELVQANEQEGRIEATVTTRWFGFKDDVVIRLSEGTAGSTVFDMRSKSRVGRSDIGVNADRIRMFSNALGEKLQ